MKHKFECECEDDEQITFFVDGKEVGSANHDEDGWGGMRSARELFESIAEVMGIKVKEMEAR